MVIGVLTFATKFIILFFSGNIDYGSVITAINTDLKKLLFNKMLISGGSNELGGFDPNKNCIMPAKNKAGNILAMNNGSGENSEAGSTSGNEDNNGNDKGK